MPTIAKPLSQAVLNFDKLPDSANLPIKDAVVLANRSKPSLYRDAAQGLIRFTKIGHSTRINVGELRRYLAGGAA